MSLNYEELLNKEVFNALDDSQKKAYIDLAQKLNGKNMSESMLIMMDFIKNAPKNERPLSADEQSAMLNAILNNLPPEDAQKFKNIMKVINLQKK